MHTYFESNTNRLGMEYEQIRNGIQTDYEWNTNRLVMEYEQIRNGI